MIQEQPQLFLEGKAKIYTKYIQQNKEGQKVQNQVFYNPIQVFNRDLSVLAMQGYINRLKKQKLDKFQGVNIVDALSASGLRTIRYILELDGVKQVIANDILPAAHKLMKDNFDLNNLNPNQYKMTLEDANVLLRQGAKGRGYDIIDLDPYGSVVPFLDSSIEAASQGGLLCITCTDTRVLCGPDLTKCFYFYGTARAKVHDKNENALRILLYTISSAASRHCKYIQPLLSLQSDFYVRVFIRIRSGKKQSGCSATKIGNIYNCESCGYYEHQRFFKVKNNHYVPERTICSSVNCPICEHPLQLNGPVWLDKIYDKTFIEQLSTLLKSQNLSLATKKKLHGLLHGIQSQQSLDEIPLGFNFDLMNKKVHSSGMSKKQLYNAVKSLGDYKIIGSYLTPGIYKSNIPFQAIYDIIKAWKLKQSGEDKYLINIKDPHAEKILNKDIKYKPNFQFDSGQKIEKVPRFISLGKGLGPKGKPGKRILQEKEQQQQLQQQQNQEQIVQKQIKSNKQTKPSTKK